MTTFSGSTATVRNVAVRSKTYPEQRLTIKDKRKVDPDPDDLARIARGLQAGPAADQPGRETDREAVAVLTDVEDVTANRELRGQCIDIGEEFAYPDRTGRPPGENIVEAGVPEQRQRVHGCLARLSEWRRCMAAR